MHVARQSSDGHNADISKSDLFILGNNLCRLELSACLEKLPYSAFHAILFSTDGEEQATIGQGAYNIPNHGAFVYCGLQG